MFFLPFGWLAVLFIAFVLSGSPREALSSLRMSCKRKPAAAEGIPMLYQVGDKKIEFTHFVESQLLVSKACQKADGRLACAAYDAVKRAANFHVGKGDDPAAQARSLCKMTSGENVDGRDEHGNEASFCRYADDSLAGHSSLLGATRK
jgi:hypothetical protein